MRFSLITACIFASALAMPVNQLQKRQDIEYVTVTADPSTPASSAAPAPAAATDSSNTNVNVNSNTNVNVNNGQASSAPSAAATSGSASPSASASSSSGSSGSSSCSSCSGSSFGSGIVYTQYQDSGACKDAGTVSSDVAQLSQYDIIRIDASDCNGLQNVFATLASHQRVMIGVFDFNNYASIISNTVIPTCQGSWDKVHSVSIGNEVVMNGQDSASGIISKVSAARSSLRSAGFNGPVVTIEAMNIINANPSIGSGSDFVAANIHPYFNGAVSASDAGNFVQTQIGMLQQSCPGKTVIVTETGWPTQGSADGSAVPSKPNQQAALSSIASAVGSNYVILSAFNELWKSGPTEEKYWGVLN